MYDIRSNGVSRIFCSGEGDTKNFKNPSKYVYVHFCYVFVSPKIIFFLGGGGGLNQTTWPPGLQLWFPAPGLLFVPQLSAFKKGSQRHLNKSWQFRYFRE